MWQICGGFIAVIFGLCSVDDRCGMELDETDPVVWGRLEAATREYLEAHDSYIKEACDTLEPPSQSEDTWHERHKNGRFSAPGKQVNKGKSPLLS